MDDRGRFLVNQECAVLAVSDFDDVPKARVELIGTVAGLPAA